MLGVLAVSLALAACKQEDTSPPVPGTSTTATEAPPAVTTAPLTTTMPPTPPPTVTASASATAAPTPTMTASAAPIGSGGVIINPPAEATRDAKIHAVFGKSCRLERTCGALWGVDCNAAGDGPYWYVKAGTLEKISGCGGLCRAGKCTNCPPKDWGCPAY